MLYRKYRRWSGADYSPDTCIRTFNFYEWIRPWIFIYGVILVFFIVIYAIRRCSNLNDMRWAKIRSQFRWNVNIKYLFIFSLPLFWTAAMAVFFVRVVNFRQQAGKRQTVTCSLGLSLA